MTKPTYRHQELAGERWSRLSLAEQLGNVGTEVGCMRRWRGKEERTAVSAEKLLRELAGINPGDPALRCRNHTLFSG